MKIILTCYFSLSYPFTCENIISINIKVGTLVWNGDTIGLLHWYQWMLSRNWHFEGCKFASLSRCPNERDTIHQYQCNKFASYSVFLFNLTLQEVLSVTVQKKYKKVISFLHYCNINLMLFLHCCCFAANLVGKTNYLSRNQLCRFTCNFQILRIIYLIFWSRVTSYFMMSSENGVSNFGVIPRQPSITKTRLFKYTENFTIKKWQFFR